MSARVTLLESQDRQLRTYLEAHPGGHERAAVVLFRLLQRHVEGLPDSDRYLAVDVIPFEAEWITDSSPSRIDFELRFLRDLFRKCEEEQLVFGFVHNHPTGYADFSDKDEANEQTLLKALTNRNGPDVHFVALLWANGEWKARIRHGRTPVNSAPVRHVLVVGHPLRMHSYVRSEFKDESLTARQAAAFGQPFVDMLRSLRVGVVGGGGTGSPTLTLLGRAGVGEIIVVDRDKLAKSNLNRVRGAGTHNVNENKARILQNFIVSLGLPTKVAAFESLIDEDPEALDALSSCDVIFGCTDDQIGREVLNTALYVYAQAYIDVGLGGLIDQDASGVPYLRYHYGRVSTILPEHGECLFCQDVLREVWIRTQYELRANPNMTQAEIRERYLENGGEHAPGVGPFTSAIADFGVATLFDLLRPFRKFPPELRRDLFKVDFVRMEIRSHEEKNDPDCVYCRKREFLLMREKYRLNRPKLGKPNVTF
jgi:hypothetical protein